MDPLVLVFALLGAALMIRLLAGSLDGDRVEQYLKSRGWTPVSQEWSPFGPGWFGDKSDRIYRVTYRDEKGALFEAHAKTSMLSGVYLTDERLVREGPAALPEQQEDPVLPEEPASAGQPDAAALQRENEALRRRVAELEGRQ